MCQTITLYVSQNPGNHLEYGVAAYCDTHDEWTLVERGFDSFESAEAKAQEFIRDVASDPEWQGTQLAYGGSMADAA